MDNRETTLLIVTVGTGRNRHDIAEAIRFSLREHGADRAVFLCSKKTQAETLPLILDELRWKGHRYAEHCCLDENDVQGLFIGWNEAWENWMKALNPGRVVVDFTSGTKPMSAAAFALAIARNAEALSYVVGDRDHTGRVTESTGIQRISPDLIVAHRELRRAAEHCQAGGYSAARDSAQPFLKIERTSNDRLREIARSVHYIAKAYEAWDRFDWGGAKTAFRESKRLWPDWPWIDNADRLAANEELVKAAEMCRKNRDFGPPLCADLLGNVDRCMHRQVWDDAVARLYRACELLAQLKLFRDHGQRTNDVDPANLPQSIREEYERRKAKAPSEKVKLGLEASYTLLKQLDDPLGIEFRQRYGQPPRWGKLQGLLDARNNSLLAHGDQPIQQEKAEQLREHVIELADIADPDIRKAWLPKARSVEFLPF